MPSLLARAILFLSGYLPLVFDAADRWVILHLLDDAYLDSDMTGLQYEANSKRELA